MLPPAKKRRRVTVSKRQVPLLHTHSFPNDRIREHEQAAEDWSSLPVLVSTLFTSRIPLTKWLLSPVSRTGAGQGVLSAAMCCGQTERSASVPSLALVHERSPTLADLHRARGVLQTQRPSLETASGQAHFSAESRRPPSFLAGATRHNEDSASTARASVSESGV